MRLREIISLPEDQAKLALEELTRSMRLDDTPHQPKAAQPLTQEQIKSLMRTWTLNFETYTEHHELMLKAARRFAYDVLSGNQARWLTFLGPSGIGKTHLLKQTLRFITRHWGKLRVAEGRYRTPQIAHIIPAEDLCDYRAPKDYARYDVVYIEDIGSGSGLDKGSGAVLRSRIAELLQLRSAKWTMLCSNLSREAVCSDLDGRIASRLQRDGSTLIQITNDVADYHG